MTLGFDELVGEMTSLPVGGCNCLFCRSERLPVAELPGSATLPVAELPDSATRKLSADALLAEIPGSSGAHIYDHTRDAVLNDGDEILNYYIDKSFGWDYLQEANDSLDTWYHSSGHSIAEVAFIEDIFNKLDPLIDLDFQRQYTYHGTEIDIYSVDYVSDWGDDPLVGEAKPKGGRYGGGFAWFDVLWKDTDNSPALNDYDRNTIVHEIGHALGLSHPNQDPFNGSWNTDDTVMSYNMSPDGWDYWFSSTDIAALQAIWGVENDVLV